MEGLDIDEPADAVLLAPFLPFPFGNLAKNI